MSTGVTILHGIAFQKTVNPVGTAVGKLRPLFMNPVVQRSMLLPLCGSDQGA